MIKKLFLLFTLFFTMPLNAHPHFTLNDAFIAAYKYYPEISASRESLKAVDENVSAALGNYRPKINVEASTGRQDFKSSQRSLFASSTTLHPKSATATIEQPLYQFGRLSNNLKKSEQDVKAGRASLDLTEQNLFIDVATAYLYTMRDKRIVDLNQSNKSLLEKTYHVAKARFDAGQTSRPDLAQAKSYLSEAIANLEQAKVNFLNTQTTFEKLIGNKPDNLDQPLFNLKLPLSVEEALMIAEKEHPLIKNAEAAYRSARFEAKRIRSNLYPTIGLKGSAMRGYETSTAKQRETQYSIMAEMRVPIYSGGITEAKTRGARHVARQRMLEKELQIRNVREGVVQSFQALKALAKQIVFRKDAVKAQRLTAQGRRHEVEVGSKTVVDLAEAERDLLNASTELVKAQTEETLAKYQLLAAIGRLNIQTLGLETEPYDAKAHLKKARRSLFSIKG